VAPGAAVLAGALVSVLWLAGCGSTLTAQPSPRSTHIGDGCNATRAKSHVTVDATSTFRFVPASACLRLGGTVTWTNTTRDLDHTSTDDPSLAASSSDASIPKGGHGWNLTLVSGHSAHLIFHVAGVYHYFCIAHETLGMAGVVIVVG
jgi:plastocyanin